jgi:general secretion pathway protein D
MTLSQNTMNIRHGARRWLCAPVHLLCVLALAAAWSGSHAQEQTITPNFKDAPLDRVIQAVQAITGKTIIIDPRVRAQVTILSSTPMSADAFYEAFLSVLQVHDFVAIPSGNTLKIVPAQNSRWMPGNDLPNRVSSSSDEMVTQVIAVKNVSALQLVPVLRPLLPQGAHFVAHAGSNTLIVSDRASNVSRIIRIIERIDQAGDDEIDIIRLENAAAADVVRTLSTLYTGAGAQQEAGTSAPKVIADDRTNSVLLSGEKAQRLRLKALIADLDTPLAAGGDTQVRYLDYADAEAIAGKLKEQITGIVQATPGAVPPAGGGGAASADKSVSMWADPQTNALIITAPPKVMRSLMSVIDKLDIRRPQVLIEAILVEISTNKAAELGVNWAIGDTSSDSTVPIGTFNQPVGGASIGSIAAAIQDPDTLATTGLPSGLTLGAGKFPDSGISFAVLLRALRGDSSTNILQTPSITTLDNEEAEIKVAQEVPFLTGSYSSTGTGGSGNNGTVNPFQTIQREEVGEILKITPQINEGNSVTLKIEQESSGIAAGSSGVAVDLITNKRTISTKVMVEDGGVIVLGGLISDRAIEGENRVPVLGAIPIIGELFKTRNGSKEKRNLMVFIRPTILRDEVSAAVATNAKYGVIRDQQLRRRGGSKVKLLPGERQPLLPPIEELSRYADPTAGGKPPAPGADRKELERELENKSSSPEPVPNESDPPPR